MVKRKGEPGRTPKTRAPLMRGAAAGGGVRMSAGLGRERDGGLLLGDDGRGGDERGERQRGQGQVRNERAGYSLHDEDLLRSFPHYNKTR